MNQETVDTRVTAYVFGELSEHDVAIFEKEMKDSLPLQREVEAIRQTVESLNAEFELQTVELDASGQDAVIDAIKNRAVPSSAKPVTVPRRLLSKNHLTMLGTLAAGFALACVLMYPAFRNQRIAMQESNRAWQSKVAESSSGERASAENPELESLFSSFSSLMDEQRFQEAEEIAKEVAVMDPQNRIAEAMAKSSQVGSRWLSTNAPKEDLEKVADVSGTIALAPSAFGSEGMIFPSGQAGGRFGESKTLGKSKDKAQKKRSGERSIGQSEIALRELSQIATSDSAAMKADHDSDGELDSVRIDSGVPGEISKSPSRVARHLKRSRRSQMAKEESGQDEMMRMGGMEMAEREMGAGASENAPRIIGDNVAFGFDDLMITNIEGRLVPSPIGGDRFNPIEDNSFVPVLLQPLSTFSVDVDTASYTKVRAMLNRNTLPRPDSVRIEELLNYFDYNYAPLSRDQDDEHPFAASMQIATCPWSPDHRLARIGIQAKEITGNRPSSNLVFLLDVSGSMDEPNKLPLVIEGMKMLTSQLTENDKVAIVVYAGAAGMVLDSTRGDKKQLITSALGRLKAGGSTNGGQGIVLAYQLATDHFIVGGTNRVILCSDGDFNVGVTDADQLVKIAEENAKSNVFLSVLGFGIGNHNDAMMEQISNKGNGNYAFIDSKAEAKKVLVEELGGTLVTVAKDVKIQIEFNPREVASYRLIGYENRLLAARDFNDDTKDAGEIGAGHTVTALYELVPAKLANARPAIDTLRYQRSLELREQANSGEMLILKLRYKQPEGNKSTLIRFPVTDTGMKFVDVDRDFQFAASVAAFGMLLRDSPHKGNASMHGVAQLARNGAKGDESGYRIEFVELVAKAKQLLDE